MWFDATRNSVDMMMDVSQEKKKKLDHRSRAYIDGELYITSFSCLFMF